MRVTVKFSGKVREYAIDQEVSLHLDDLMDVSGLLTFLINRYPEIARIRKFLFISINGKLAPRDLEIKDGDEVMLFFRPGGG